MRWISSFKNLNRTTEADKNGNTSDTQCGISLPRNIEKEEESKRQRDERGEHHGRKRNRKLQSEMRERERERKETEKYEKSREVHLFSKCPKKVVVGYRRGERIIDTWPMTYIKVANDRAQTQSSVSWRSGGGVFKSVLVDLFFFSLIFPRHTVDLYVEPWGRTSW